MMRDLRERLRRCCCCCNSLLDNKDSLDPMQRQQVAGWTSGLWRSSRAPAAAAGV